MSEQNALKRALRQEAAARIQQAIQATHWRHQSDSALARRMNIPLQTLYNVMRGLQYPSPALLLALNEVLGVDPNWICFGDDGLRNPPLSSPAAINQANREELLEQMRLITGRFAQLDQENPR